MKKHQIWYNHPLNQRNKATERGVEVVFFVGRGEWWGVGCQHLIMERCLGNIGGIHKLWGVTNHKTSTKWALILLEYDSIDS